MRETAEEIIEQTGGKLDYMVMSAGHWWYCDGRSPRNSRRRFQVSRLWLSTHMAASWPCQTRSTTSPRARDRRDSQRIRWRGIGYDFIPTVLDREVVDYWVKSDDDESFAMGRNILRHEGLLIGGSCGSGRWRGPTGSSGSTRSVLASAWESSFADSSRNYMTKFMEDEWLNQNGFDAAQAVRTTEEKGLYDELFGI